MPPLRGTGYTEMMTAAAKTIGLHPFPGPAAIASVPYEGRPGTAYHGWCDRAGCHINAKSSTAVSTIPKALATKRLQIVTGARVTAVEVGRSGRVTGVTYVKDGEVYFQPAAAVILASYVYENVRLLLLSKSKAFPNGLANNHGQVGRHYMSHNQGAHVTALFARDINTWYGMPAQGVGVDNWADDNFDHSGLDFIGGGNMWVYSSRRPILTGNMTTFGKTKGWGSEWKAFVMKNADRTNGAYLQKTTLPYEDNLIDLDPVVKDPLGLAVPRITADFKDNERKIAAFMQDKMVDWYRAAGAVEVERERWGPWVPPPTVTAARAWGIIPRPTCRPLGLRPRSAQSGRGRRRGDGNQRLAQPHPHPAGPGLAHRPASGGQVGEPDELNTGPRQSKRTPRPPLVLGVPARLASALRFNKAALRTSAADATRDTG